MWETGKLTSTPGIQRIMPRNEYSLGSVLTQTYKWYIALFHWILDQAVINACVIYSRENNVEKQGMRQFRQDLAEQLVTAGGLQLDMLIDDRYAARVAGTRLKTTTQEGFTTRMGGFGPVRTRPCSKKIDFLPDNGGPWRAKVAASSHHTYRATVHGRVEEADTKGSTWISKDAR